MSIKENTTTNNRSWTARRLIELSQNLSQGYYPQLNNVESTDKTDSWTTEKFINLSRYLSSAYGVDF